MTPSGFGSPVPQGPSGPAPQPGAPPPGISGLVGGVPNATPMGPTPQQRIANFSQQVMMLQAAMDALATDHPESSNELNDAKNALTAALSKVATMSASPEVGSQPPTF